MARGFAEILATLKRSEVEFIVVGGAAAVLQGVPITTLDIDVARAVDMPLPNEPRRRQPGCRCALPSLTPLDGMQ